MKNTLSTQSDADALSWLFMTDNPGYELVSDTLVSEDFMIVLASAIEGKINAYANVTHIPELIGQRYYDSLNPQERAVVGDCIIRLIETQRVQLDRDSWPM